MEGEARRVVATSGRILMAAIRAAAEVEARAAGVPPDRRFDPIVDALLDEADRQDKEALARCTERPDCLADFHLSTCPRSGVR
jgi:hypothetical protein